jgi:hypothetical protein
LLRRVNAALLERAAGDQLGERVADVRCRWSSSSLKISFLDRLPPRRHTLIMRIELWPILLAACAGAQAANAAPVANVGSIGPSIASADKPPGPIGGVFRVTCAENQGELIELTVRGTRAVGTVVEPGASAKYGFRKGEEVFRLNVDDGHGDWVGQVHWRGVSGAEHWDSIRFAASVNELVATMTNEPCYRNMPRAR